MPIKDSLANAGPYSARVQDSHILTAMGELLALDVKLYRSAVDLGDMVSVAMHLESMRVLVEHATLRLKYIESDTSDSKSTNGSFPQ